MLTFDVPPTDVYRYSNDEQSFPITNDERLVSFVVNDGAFNSTPTFACIRLVDFNDLPELFTGPNSTVDTMVMYREGQTEPLLIAPQLDIRGTCRREAYKLASTSAEGGGLVVELAVDMSNQLINSQIPIV